MHPGILAQIANPAGSQQNFAQAMNQGTLSALRQQAVKQGMRATDENILASQQRRGIAQAQNQRAQAAHGMAMEKLKAVQELKAPLMQFEASIGAPEKEDQAMMMDLARQVSDPELRKLLEGIMQTPHGKERDAVKTQVLDLFKEQGLYGGSTSLDKEKTRADIMKGLMGNAPTPTDADDYIKDKEAEYLLKYNTKMPPGMRADFRLAYKRAQREEVYLNRLASRTADKQTAFQIAQLGQKGKMLAEIMLTPKLIKAKGEETPIEKKQSAKVKLEGHVAHLADLYLKLDGLGGIVNIEKGPIHNLVARGKSTEMGQGIMNAFGFSEQSVRNTIKDLKPLIMNEVRQASNMGARGLDSEKELQFYMQAMTDEKRDLQSNVAALIALSRAYGLNEGISKSLAGIADPAEIEAHQKRAFDILHRSRAKWGQIPYQPADPNAPKVTEDFYSQLTQPPAPTGQQKLPLAQAQQMLIQDPSLKDIFIETYGAENLPGGVQ